MMVGISTGLSGAAVARATDALLHSLGGDTVALVFPLASIPNDPGAQLGLADPGVKQVNFSPVIVKSLATNSSGPLRRTEFLISGSAVAAELSQQNAPSGEALFAGSLGLLYDGDLYHIESVTPEYFGGTPYLYRVIAVE